MCSFGEFWSTLAHNELRCPQTMIFSTTDPLINFRNVEEMAAAREALGVRVTRFVPGPSSRQALAIDPQAHSFVTPQLSVLNPQHSTLDLDVSRLNPHMMHLW